MRFYRILLNIISSTFRNLTGLLLGIIATPIILNHLGEEKFGAFRTLYDWITHLAILEFGLFPSLLAIFAKALSHHSNLSIKTITKEAYKKYFLVSIYQLIGVAALYLFIDDLIAVSEASREDLHRALILIGVFYLFSFSQIYRAFLDASQRGYIISTIMILQNIFLVGFSVTFAMLGWGITGQAAAVSLSMIITTILMFTKSHNHLQKEQLRSEDEYKVKNALRQQRSSNFIANICGNASLISDNLIIAAFLNAKTVTAFYLTQRLLVIGRGQLQQMSNATWPAMSEIYHQRQGEEFSKKILEVTEFIAFCSGVLLSILCFVNPPFVILWTGENTFAGLTLSCIALYNAGIIGIVSFWQWCFVGTGLIGRIIPVLITQAIVNVALSLLLTNYIGILGPVIGTLISFQFITVIWQSYLLFDTFEVPLLPLTRSWVIPMVLPLGLSIFTINFVGYIKLGNWFELILFATGVSALVLCSFPFLFVGKKVRIRFLTRIQKTILKRLR